jgi:hypothetical protein
MKALFIRCNILKSRYKRCSLEVKRRLFWSFCICFYGTALWTCFNVGTLKLFSACYIKCMKNFFGVAKYHSVTSMLLELNLPSLQTLLTNAKHNFSRCLLNCGTNNAFVNVVHCTCSNQMVL